LNAARPAVVHRLPSSWFLFLPAHRSNRFAKRLNSPRFESKRVSSLRKAALRMAGASKESGFKPKKEDAYDELRGGGGWVTAHAWCRDRDSNPHIPAIVFLASSHCLPLPIGPGGAQRSWPTRPASALLRGVISSLSTRLESLNFRPTLSGEVCNCYLRACRPTAQLPGKPVRCSGNKAFHSDHTNFL